ncbi:MAG: hypothetical protein B6D56_02310 [Candidatus Omnitrophica bacterium 4484_70.1]|nr:MAG: hypothetical protein B6D56_02310 [Candidatus Omnitrophica bacterium 4484_70.1]
MSEKYDVVIIGAGIGGLVCGCYLAKAGLKVLIVEKNDKPGGYCTSFERDGFKFDVGPHYFGSLREDEGILFRILKELDLLDRIKFVTSDPTDRIITPDKTIFIRKNKEDTKKELMSHFPQEKENINDFFKFVLHKDFLYILSKTKKITFKKLLNSFFKDEKLKSALSVLTINLNLPPSKASALVMTVLLREFIFDGGYYPKGGMQVFSDLLAQRFKEYGGRIILSRIVKKIITKRKKVKAVELDNGELILSKIVVSNADATLTFKKLLDCHSKEAEKVRRLKPSYSAFVVFLGLKKKLKIKPPHFVTWFLSDYDVERIYRNINLSEEGSIKGKIIVFPPLEDTLLSFREKNTMRAIVIANYQNIWKRYKEKICNKIIKRLSFLIPDLERLIEIKEIATPYTFYRYTFNKRGALFGWQATPNQIDRNVFPPQVSVKNLYLVGHWVTSGIGHGNIPMVAFCGKRVFRLILKREKR